MSMMFTLTVYFNKNYVKKGLNITAYKQHTNWKAFPPIFTIQPTITKFTDIENTDTESMSLISTNSHHENRTQQVQRLQTKRLNNILGAAKSQQFPAKRVRQWARWWIWLSIFDKDPRNSINNGVGRTRIPLHKVRQQLQILGKKKTLRTHLKQWRRNRRTATSNWS